MSTPSISLPHPAVSLSLRPLQLLAAAALLWSFANRGHAAATAPASWETPPGWTQTRGGDDGKVIRVTTLSARGVGSLGEALAATGARRIEFAVAGTIDLEGRSYNVTQPYLTIAGETAPTPGITLRNGGMNVNTHDVIVRHIRIRPGAGNRPKKSGWEVDSLATGGGAHDVIIDHCTLNWSTDENLSASGPRFSGATPDDWRKNTSHRITFSHCIVGEGLHDSAHGKGPHSMGSLIHDNASEIAIIGNLYISNNQRNPLFKGGARGAFVNNVIQNPGTRMVTYGIVPAEWTGHPWERGAMVVVGNVARKGQSTAADTAFFDARGPLDAHLADNQLFDAKGGPLAVTMNFRDPQTNAVSTTPPADFRRFDQPMFWPPRLKAKPAGEVKEWVLANAGARPWERDAVETRLINEARSGGGKIIHYESEVGGALKARP